MTDMTRPDIDLHIEELALHGFASADRYRIGEALERELARLFTEQGVPQPLMQGGELPNLSLGSFQVRLGAKTEAIGAQVAQAIYKGLSTGVPRAHIPAVDRVQTGRSGESTKAQSESKGGSGK